MKVKDLALIVFFSFWGLDQAYKHEQQKQLEKSYTQSFAYSGEEQLEQIRHELRSYRRVLERNNNQDQMLLSRRMEILENRLKTAEVQAQKLASASETNTPARLLAYAYRR